MTTFSRNWISGNKLGWLGLVLALWAGAVGTAQAQATWLWATGGQTSGTQNSSAGGMGVDPVSGATATGGQFTGTLTFAGGPALTSVGFVNAFVARHDSLGALVWARQIITSQNVGVNAIAFDGAGNAYVAGSYNGTLQFGIGGPTLTSSTTSAFVARYAPDGTVGWARSFGGTGSVQVNALAADAAGSVRLCGSFNGAVQFGSIPLNNSGTSGNAYLARLDATGTTLWATALTGTNFVVASAVALTPTGDAVLAGYFQSPTLTATGGVVLTNTAATKADIFLVRYSGAGVAQWGRSGGGPESEFAAGVALDATGAITVVGSIGPAAATFGPGVSTGAGPAGVTTTDILVVHYDAAGTALWARRDGGPLAEAASGVAADASGNLYVSTAFQGSQVFGPVFVSSRGGYDALVLKYSGAAGAILGATAGGGLDTDSFQEIGRGPGDVIVAAGYTGARGATFGSFTRPAGGNSNLLVARLSRCPAVQPVLTVTPTAGVVGQPLAFSISNPQPNTSYSWTGPNLTVAANGLSATAVPQVVGPAIYAVLATTNGGCRAQQQVTVLVSAAPYCVAGLGGSGCPIGRVLLRNTTFHTTASTCQLVNGSQYSSYPATDSATATLALGSSYTLVVQTVAGQPTPTALAGWLDANQNGLFEASEYLTLPVIAAGSGTAVATITVPATALPGAVRLRLRASATALPAAGACASSSTGETRDYTFTLTTGTNASLSTPYCAPLSQAGCGPADIMRVTLLGTNLDNASNCALDASGNAYTRYPANMAAATGLVVLSRSYTLQVSTNGPATVGAWVDWNHNNQFEAIEFLSVPTTGTTGTVMLAVPPGAQAGLTRLRLRARPAGSPLTAANACTAFASGETEDYDLTVFDPSPAWRWARRGGSTGSPPSQSLPDDDVGQAAVTDSQGNIYVTGSYWAGQPAVFGNVTLGGAGSSVDILLVKYDSTGTCLWARGIGGSSSLGNPTDEGLAVAVDSLDNVYLTGHFFGQVRAGSFTLTTAGNGAGDHDVLVVKYNPAGTVLWAQQAGGGSTGLYKDEWGYALAVRGNRVFVGGFFRSPIMRFGTIAINLTPSTGSFADGFVASLRADNGQWQWARALGGAGTDVVQALTVGKRGELYATGYFEGTATFGSSTFVSPSSASTSTFVARLDPATGAPLWAQSQLSNQVAARSIVTDGSGSIYVSSNMFASSVTLSGGTAPLTLNLVSGSSYNFVLAKYTPGGALVWGQLGQVVGSAFGNALGVDAANNLYLGGNFNGSLGLGVNAIQSTSSSDIFVAKFDAAGTPLWGRAANGSRSPGSTSGFIYESCFGLAVTPAGEAYATGYITGTVRFPKATGRDSLITAAGDYDFYLARLGGGCAGPAVSNGPDQQACNTLSATLGQPAQPGINYSWTVSPALPGFPTTVAQPTVQLAASGNSATTYAFTVVASTPASGLGLVCPAAATTFFTVFPTPPTPVITQQGQAGGTLLTSSATAGNQWLLGTTPIPGATASSYLATQPGTYSVVVTNAGGCTSTTATTVTVVTASRKAASAAQLLVYPNPVPDSHLTVALTHSQPVVFTLLNALGQPVRNLGTVSDPTTPRTFDLTGLAPGVYVLQALAPGFTTTRRVVVR